MNRYIPQTQKITAQRAKPIAERAREVHSAHKHASAPPEYSLAELLADPSRVFVARDPVAKRPPRMRRRHVELPHVCALRACELRNGLPLPEPLDYAKLATLR